MSIRIIATGGHSGLGFEALKALLASPALVSGCSLALMVRDEQAGHVTRACQTLRQQYRAKSQSQFAVETRPMDLSSLASVRKAASSLKHQLKAASTAQGLDIFLLNAALAKSNRETVTDQDRASGSLTYPSDHLLSENSCIETTACVNHVGHLLFLSCLLPAITQNAKDGRKTRIVFTGSALHRSLKDLSLLDTFFSSSSHSSSSEKPWTLRETYAASKFLQMLGVRALRRRIQEALTKAGVPSASVEVVVAQPGFVPQTALCRESGPLARFAMSYLLPWAPFATSLDDAGRYIANACTVELPVHQSEEQQDGFHDTKSIVPSALLEVHQKKQRFATLDARTADKQLQEKWWPVVCDHL
ncbi:uncharacterized protein UHOD_02314 [Ustilago sp. UG-2017b]|nr:uncharacterized protein UHOD_02314 [Ustilago sp. UG-2017b]